MTPIPGVPLPSQLGWIPAAPRRRRRWCPLPWMWLGCLGALALSAADREEISPLTATHPDRGYSYSRDVVTEIPWSIHVFKWARTHRELVLTTTLGGSNHLGMSTVSEQLARLDPELGQPIAAVNGDFYTNEPQAPGDPRDVQIHQGELVSAPAGHACFWLDSAGQPQSTNVVSRFACVLPDGTRRSMGLNEQRAADAVVLYTPRMGSSTRTQGGLELLVEPIGPDAGRPLRVESILSVRVNGVRRSGDTPIPADGWVLSLGPGVASKTAGLSEGALIRLETRTSPALAGVQMAIGGGPTLVRNGRAKEWSGILMRHPRTAIGWNKDAFFLVEVDGRQSQLSVGMTFPELAGYMLKLGCEEAMNLDGGGSATLWVRGNVMNSPSEGRERPGANSIVVLQPRVRHARSQ